MLMFPRIGILVFCLALAGGVARATPCARVKSQPDAWVKARADALILAARAVYEDDDALTVYERVIDNIEGTLRRCRLAEDENFAGRYREFVEYVETASLERSPDHELGFVVPDRQYFAETQQFVQIPEFLTAPQFLRYVSRHETLESAKSFLRQLNSTRDASNQLLFFSYKSRHLGTPDNDNSFERLLIVVPGSPSAGIPEKWVQFGVTDPGVRTRTRNVSVVSTMAGSDGTSNVYFKDFYRSYRRDGTITINGRWELGYGDDNCVKCHKSGILPIFPVAGSVAAGEQTLVEVVNQRFISYGTPSFGKYLDPTRLGPGLGAASVEDRSRRFGASFGDTTVARSMSCAACHKHEWLGSFNWPMDKTIISSYIKGGPMPLGHKLQTAERNELYEKLISEYFSTDDSRPGILKSWLLGRLR
jgi:hypothetical protein